MTLCAVLVVPVSSSAQTPPAAQTPAPTVQDQDLVLGTWVLDLKRSTFQPGPAPRGQVRSYQQEHEGIKAQIKTVQPDGNEVVIEYVASYNDVVALVTGAGGLDAVKMRKIDANTAEETLMSGGNPVGMARRVISPDGKTRTIALTRTAPTPVKNVEVYVKEDATAAR